MKQVENVVANYKHFVFVDLTHYNGSRNKGYYRGSICIINDILFQFVNRDDQFQFEPINKNDLSKYKIAYDKITSIIQPNETIGVIICNKDKLSQYEYTIPNKITADTFIVE